MQKGAENMAKPISTIQKHIQTEEEEKNRKLEELKSILADNDTALNETLTLLRELHQSGMLEAAGSMLKAKEKIAEIAVSQAAREPVTNLINHATGAAGALAATDPEMTKKLVNSVLSGLNEANDHLQHQKQLGLLDLVKALKDPDINRAAGFGLAFLKGMGKELNE
jgi:uncharacterized protein YjgD (DUF1641 family)